MNNGAIFGATWHGVRRLPRSLSYAIGHVGSSLVAAFAPESTAAIADNLRAVFPDEPEARLRQRAVETYRSYTRDTIDFIRAVDNPATEHAFDLGPDTRERAERMVGMGRGALIVTAHFGNWEAGGLLMSRALKLPLTVVAMREPSETVNRIRNDIRQRIGIETIEVRQSLDTPLKIRAALAQNRFVALLVDRHMGRDRVPVTLFGRRAWFLRTPLLLAALTGAPIAVCSVERSGPGRFLARMDEPLTIPRDEAKDMWIPRAAQEIATSIETRVRARPECWYHFYRYWNAQRDDYTGLD